MRVKLDPVPGCGKPVARATGASWEARGRPAPGKGKTVGPGGNWLCASMRDCATHGLGTSPSGSVLQAQETHQGWRGAQGAGRYQAKPPNILGGEESTGLLWESCWQPVRDGFSAVSRTRALSKYLGELQVGLVAPKHTCHPGLQAACPGSGGDKRLLRARLLPRREQD